MFPGIQIDHLPGHGLSTDVMEERLKPHIDLLIRWIWDGDGLSPERFVKPLHDGCLLHDVLGQNSGLFRVPGLEDDLSRDRDVGMHVDPIVAWTYALSFALPWGRT